PDDPPWLVPKLIPVEAVVRVSGPRKRGRKSYLMGVISTLLATGLKLGEIKPIQAEPVLYVQEEGPRGMTRDRLE
ncbi:MAG: AAA family ATPase, partial [Anaerolineae bacterium]|nr:AAA family ATPase [Anaerolineae bacterium]